MSQFLSAHFSDVEPFQPELTAQGAAWCIECIKYSLCKTPFWIYSRTAFFSNSNLPCLECVFTVNGLESFFFFFKWTTHIQSRFPGDIQLFEGFKVHHRKTTHAGTECDAEEWLKQTFFLGYEGNSRVVQVEWGLFDFRIRMPSHEWAWSYQSDLKQTI